MVQPLQQCHVAWAKDWRLNQHAPQAASGVEAGATNLIQALMRDESPQLRALHGVYCQLAQAQLALTMTRMYYWSAFLARGFTESDLCLVLRYLWHEIKAERRRYGSLKFSNLIMDIDRFEEDVQLARGWERNHRPAPSPKERVLAQARPVACERVQAKENVRSVSEVIAAMREAAR